MKGPNSPAVKAAKAVAPTIKQWAGAYLSTLSFSGSYAKGTAINSGTDIDIFISLTAQTPNTLKEIYNSLYRQVERKGWEPRRQNVSIGISYGNIWIDLVPARIQPGYRNWHSLYKRKSDSWTQTNVAAHINAVSKSGRTNEIRAVKIWRNLNSLDFPSFYLELVVIEALKGRSRTALAVNVLHALEYLSSYLTTTRIVDPGNTNNVISDDLSQTNKRKIAKQAADSVQQQYWENIIW